MKGPAMAGNYDVELPTQKLPTPPKPVINALIASLENMEAMNVPAMMCIYGDQGTGKTFSLMEFIQGITAPGKRIIYVDSAAGWTSLNNKRSLMNRVKRMKFENMEQLIALAAAIRDKVPPFDTVGAVVLDEYSSMVKKDKTWIVKARSQQKEKNGEFKDPFQPAQPDYLASQIRSEDVLNAFLECDIHVGFTSHEKYDDKTLMTRPDFPPGASNDFQRLIHSVLRATVTLDKTTKVVKRRLQLQPIGNRVSVKNRIGGLGNFADDISEVIEAYKKWGVEDLQDSTTDTTLTQEEVEQITKDDDLLLLLNKDAESSDAN